MSRPIKELLRQSRLWTVIATGLSALCLMTSCASSTKPVCPAPPLELLAPIELPDRSQAKTQGDLVRLLVEDQNAIERKNADLGVLREYYSK